MQQKVFAVLLSLIFAAGVFAQTVHQVAAGDDLIKAAYDAAAPGDIIELTTDGGVYTESAPMDIDKDITIRGAAGLANKPILRCSDAGDPVFKVSGSAVKVQIENLEIDGTDGAGTVVSKYFVILDNDDVSGSVILKVLDCIAHDFTDKHIKAYPDCGIDSLIVDKTILYNGAKEGITLYSGSSGDAPAIIAYASITNSTFYGFVREAIKGQTYTDTKVILDRNTFYDIGTEGKSMVYFRNMTDVEVKNSIFAKNQHGDTDKFADFADATTLFHHNSVFDVVNVEVGKATVSDTVHLDPGFADADNGDFTLPAGSALLTFADDGGAIGDPRWNPNAGQPRLYRIEAGTDVISPVINAAAAGDTLELVTNGGVYLNSEQIEIDKDLVIRGKADLVNKPILKYIGTSTGAYMFKIEKSPKIQVRNLEFDGDGTAEGAAALAKYALRLDNGDAAGTMQVLVENCVLHDFNEKIIKPYADCGIDSLLIRNNIFYNGSKEGLTLYSGSSNDPAVQLDYAEIVNCTFYGFTREAIKGDTNPATKVRINQCTFYDCGGPDKPFIYVDDMTDVIIKNSIFQRNNETGNFIRLESDANIVNNIVVWDVNDWEIDNSNSIADTLNQDPQFADAANGDFTLAEASPARTAGEGGLPAGDLRWAIDPNKVLLSVVTTGNGNVTLDPPGGIYDPGTAVTMTATPDANWIFTGWSGNVNVFPPDNPVATVTVNENMTVTANFESNVPKYTLTIDVVGLGDVQANPQPNENGMYDEGTQVTLTPQPGPNWAFEQWAGDVLPANVLANPVVVQVDSNMTVIANFVATIARFTLDVTVVGEGSVSLTPAPFMGQFDTLTVVTLTATPVQGWTFTGFAGDLIGTATPDSILMNSDKEVFATFEEIQFASHAMEIDTTWDLRDAVEFANNNSTIDTLVLITSGGLYTSIQASDVTVMKPLTIIAKPGLAQKPIVTNSDAEKTNDDVFRVFDDFTLVGVVLDGGHTRTHGPKYAIRMRHYTTDSVKVGTNIKVLDCDFVNFFEDKDLKKDGHCFKVDVFVLAGDVLFEGCTFTGTGYEAIRISDTEKWATDKTLESLTVRNCTFTNIDAEAVRFYSDIDAATPDAPVLLEHITINGSATRVFYLKNSGGAIARDIIVANSRPSGHGRDDDLMDVQGNTETPSYVSDIDTFNVAAVPIKADEGEVDSNTIWGINPQFENAAEMNYTLLAGSHLYGLGHDGEALGDLNWATNQPSHVTLTVLIEGEGDVNLDPMPVGLTYDQEQDITLTAVPDSGYQFVGWSGALTGSENPAFMTLIESKEVTATFEVIDTGVQNQIPTEYSLNQNYPNPFNPTTTISFGLKAEGHTTVKLFDMLGREVATLADRDMDAGRYDLKFHSGTLASGVYFYTITSRDFKATRKMMLMK